MKVHEAIETPEGTVIFRAEFGKPELEFMVEYFCNTMFARGMLPFAAQREPHEVVPITKPTEQ